MEKTLQEIENEVVDEFSMFDEWLDKYEYLKVVNQGFGLIIRWQMEKYSSMPTVMPSSQRG